MKKIPQFISEQIYLFIYIIMVGIGLVAAVIILSNTVVQTAANNGESSTGLLEFDQSRIDRINSLETSDNTNQAPVATPGRVNPFSE